MIAISQFSYKTELQQEFPSCPQNGGIVKVIQENEMKTTQIRKEELKLFLFIEHYTNLKN